MPLGSIYESRYIKAIEENAFFMGLSSSKLMESAGRCVADFVVELIENSGRKISEEKILVLAGRGGNAGDGLVAARYLKIYGANVTVALLFEPKLFSHEDAVLNYNLWIRDGGSIINVFSMNDAKDLLERLNTYSVLIDAIFGTGIKYPLPEHISYIINNVNSTNKPIKVSIDIPSGIDPDNGIVGNPVFKSDYTIALHYLKKAYFLVPDHCGQLRVCNLGIPSVAEEYVGPGHLRNLLKMKPLEAKKGDGGRVVVIGGSIEYVGAPSLSGLAALKTGADLVYVVVPEKIRNIVASFSPSLITVPMGDEYLDWKKLDNLWNLINRADVVVIGPGMSFNDETILFFNKFIEKWKRTYYPPLVIDADALKCLSEEKHKLMNNAVVTPHRGEFDRLASSYGIDLSGDNESRVRSLANRMESVVLLKGPIDYICSEKACIKNKTGNPGMSVGGTGDVLTGIIAAFVKRTNSLFESAFLAAYVNGVAGDILYKERKEFFDSMDLVEFIPIAIKNSLEGK